ncbi:MAG: hypothetical protein WC107_05695 [Patescibacteria group bacterium]
MSDERRMELLSMSTGELVEHIIQTEISLSNCIAKRVQLILDNEQLKTENKVAIEALEKIGKYGGEGDSYGVFRMSAIGEIVHSVLDSRNIGM